MLRVVRHLLILGMLFGTCFQAHARDRFDALSMLESGNNDQAIGLRGEISRFQVRPDVWKRYSAPGADWTNPRDALAVAKAIMKERCAAFERVSNRPPTDFEFYILWNAPAQIEHPSRRVAQRARRFCNLLDSD